MRFAIVAALMIAVVGGPTIGQQAVPPRLGKGYLASAAPPESLALSPAPPARRSAAAARDVQASKAARKLKGSARWDLATRDADLFTPAVTGTFSCAANVEISAQSTPAVDRLLRRAGVDLALSTSAIKRKYQRPRPFMVNKKPTCAPTMEAVLRRDGSYPSGHSAVGFGWGLILAELLPDRANQIVARGRAFGDSRRICNAHWLSDIEEGRIVASAMVARLHADRQFREDLEAARAELAGPGNATPTRDCAAEAAALDLTR
jgi:acid phosphatase (class A)